MDEDRKKRIDRIRALLAKTVENGCTEDEAVSAAAKAAELMDLYDLDKSDLDIAADPFVEQVNPINTDIGPRLGRVARAIATLTGTRSWLDNDVLFATSITFFGRDTDVEVATYLYRIAERAMSDGLARFRPEVALFRAPVARSRCQAFLDGMADSLARRVLEIHWIRQKTPGKGLVVAKQHIVAREMEKRGFGTANVRGPMSRAWGAAYASGRAAGDDVALDPGLGGSSPATRIGKHE